MTRGQLLVTAGVVSFAVPITLAVVMMDAYYMPAEKEEIDEMNRRRQEFADSALSRTILNPIYTINWILGTILGRKEGEKKPYS